MFNDSILQEQYNDNYNYMINKYRKIRLLLIRITNKNHNQLLRLIFTRTPLLSIFGHLYYHIRFHTKYYNFINRKALRRYQATSPNPSQYTQNAVSALKTDGIYIDDIENLCHDQSMLTHLVNEANTQLSPHLQEPADPNQLRPAKIRGIGRNINDAYIPEFFVKFFLSDEVLDIVNLCYGMFSRLNYVDTWHNVTAADDDPLYDTEIWHRDHEDMKIIKVFMYLSNVDKGTGPFTFIKGTHLQGKMGHIHPANPPLGVLIDEQQIAEFTKPEQSSVIICTGKPGTVIFSDTTGIHKGGRTASEPRTVLVAFYTSAAGVDQHTYRLPENIDPNTLTPAAKYALHLEQSLNKDQPKTPRGIALRFHSKDEVPLSKRCRNKIRVHKH